MNDDVLHIKWICFQTHVWDPVRFQLLVSHIETFDHWDPGGVTRAVSCLYMWGPVICRVLGGGSARDFLSNKSLTFVHSTRQDRDHIDWCSGCQDWGDRLPVVLGRAVASGLAVLQGVVDGVHDGGVLVSDVHSEIFNNKYTDTNIPEESRRKGKSGFRLFCWLWSVQPSWKWLVRPDRLPGLAVKVIWRKWSLIS